MRRKKCKKCGGDHWIGIKYKGSGERAGVADLVEWVCWFCGSDR